MSTSTPSPVQVGRRLMQPRWLVWVALAIAYAVAAYHLGWWQWNKYAVKDARGQRIEAARSSTPIPLGQVPGALAATPLPADQEWAHVTVTGSFVNGETLFVRNRPNDGVYGYEVLTPIKLTSGERLLVDRGWVRNSNKGAASLPEVPAVISTPITVTGWLRVSETDLDRSLPAGQLASINVPEAARSLNTVLRGSWLQLDQSVTPSPGLSAPEDPDTSTGINIAYAIQWWMSMPVALLFVFFRARREVMDDAGVERPVKVRIWDEEDS